MYGKQQREYPFHKAKFISVTHFEVSVAALILKNVAFDSLATAFA